MAPRIIRICRSSSQHGSFSLVDSKDIRKTGGVTASRESSDCSNCETSFLKQLILPANSFKLFLDLFQKVLYLVAFTDGVTVGDL